ncbi:hypothetical protein B0A52_06852 [Exophiala mesophila]|uniref:Pisatin demethylase n=1 Tax=Exophiala mesophila TaxID=212818 RepID=A0A438N088_EXOME|nr:hypothetical protein B0A52_06852 [Exophiala mesophila]
MQIKLGFLFLSLLFALHFIRTIYRQIVSPQRSIPGPFFARFGRFWYFWRVQRGSFHHDNIALHAKYGPIVRVAENMYSIDVPDKNVYGIGSKFPKSDWYEGWKHPSPDRFTVFPDRNMKRHAETRKKFQNLYSMSSLVSYEKYVDNCIDIFLQRMGSFSQSGELIDLAHWFQCYAFDVMGEITYSERFGFLDHGKDIGGILVALDNSMMYSTLAGIYSWAHPYLYAIMEKIPGSGAVGRNFLMKFVQQKIAERNQSRDSTKGSVAKLQDQNAPRDFLTKLSDAHERDPEKVTGYHIFMMGLSNIIAGSDTTAVSLSSVLYHLARNPATLTRLRRELQELQQSREVDQPTAGDKEVGFISFKEAQALPYLQAVIKEALRLHPATGLPLWRVVPEGGALIAGNHLPAGAIVGINSWVAHYNPAIFGPDANTFRPERWLESPTTKDSEEQLRNMEANYLPVCRVILSQF